ncbi:MAG: hypothetical protein K9H25_20190 [Rhodospirillum sp.]|nr:hypothetical protein [Rhodospirillum sp.]MCF8491499.1 hypothetical protein [Rhodospirillum sp.]MCF8499807.1 hypothetical protein [Rhodospirillum sp.]
MLHDIAIAIARAPRAPTGLVEPLALAMGAALARGVRGIAVAPPEGKSRVLPAFSPTLLRSIQNVR